MSADQTTCPLDPTCPAWEDGACVTDGPEMRCNYCRALRCPPGTEAHRPCPCPEGVRVTIGEGGEK